MSKRPLNEKQTRVYKYLVECLADSLPPSVREIAAACGIKSTSTVHAILSRLEEEGYISRDPRNSRAIRIEGMSKASQVPLIGKVTAGVPILAVEQIEDYIPYPVSASQSESVFALRVSGLSMRDAGILDGDIIVADKDLACRSGDIVVGMIDDEATVKRLLIKDGEVILMPENPDFEPIRAPYIEILGKVIGSFRKY
ncbi:MAG: transcriptional repressor LexA [Clostridia bacterium]|nr:transcriptional repressor LexA [Clostridia bacterium]